MSIGNTLRQRRTLGIAILIVASFVVGFMVRGPRTTQPPGARADLEEIAGSQASIWTCSMHPQVQLPASGPCPICGMDLIPLENDTKSAGQSERRLVMSDYARKLAEIQTVAVVRKEAFAEIRMVGKIEYDQTLLSHVTAWVPGRLDRMFVDYEGIEIRQGDHMVDIYSPELLTAQTELLEAARAAETLRKSDLPSMRQTADATVNAARERLRLWGLTPQQIQEVERRGEPTDHVTLFAPTSGIVVGKNVTEGMYVDTGTRIYTVADLSSVWVVLDAYESDISWIRFGQKVLFSLEAYPGEEFQGRISFIDPVLNAETRTVKVRVNVENPHLRLKPEMFVRATIQARLADGGKVMDPELADKWICPMHPEVVEDHAGACPKCGMDVVPAEKLGYVSAAQAPLDLLVPASAVLRTGERAIVYVEIPDSEQPTFEGREIVLGPRAGKEYVVRQGLQEGERVVAHGNFKIDSALQIQARPSMMSPEGGAPVSGHSHRQSQRPSQPAATHSQQSTDKAPLNSMDAPRQFVQSLSAFYESYGDLQIALASDDVQQAKAAFVSLQKASAAAPMQTLSGDAHMRWMEYAKELASATQKGQKATSLEEARLAFRRVSDLTLSMLGDFGHAGETPLYQFHCPMAFSNAGADWLQATDSTRNPYFGSSMLRCGSVQATITPRGSAHDDHDSKVSEGGK